MTMIMTDYKILVVDDEPDLREILQCNLESAGYRVETAASGEEAISLLTPEYSLILLDVMMGGMSGFKTAEHIRKTLNNYIPIIFLTAKDTENDLLTGFSAGGDDYISKPFSLHEVLARIKAVLRRVNAQKQPAATLSLDNLKIDFERKLVTVDGRDVRLSPKEFGIVSMLAAKPGRVYSRDEILKEVWRDTAYVLDRTVDVHIKRLREKLEGVSDQWSLKTVWGVGYKFEVVQQ